MCEDGVIAECCTRMKCIPGGGFHVTNVCVRGKEKKTQQKNLTSIQKCVPAQSKPMSYTEIRDRIQVFDIQASLVQVVDRNYMPHDFFPFLFFISNFLI